MAAILADENTYFPEWKCINFDFDFTGVCSQRSNEQYSSTGSDNGLVPARQQAIIWNNDSLVYWSIYPSLGLNKLTKLRLASLVQVDGLV